MKEVDSLTGEYIYRNKRTGNVSRRKPIFLGSDDLDTPRCVFYSVAIQSRKVTRVGESILLRVYIFITLINVPGI